MRFGSLEFLFHDVPTIETVEGDALDAATVERLWALAARELALRGAVHPDSFKLLRKVLKLTVAQVADLLGVVVETVTAWEAAGNAAGVPRAAWVVLAAAVLQRDTVQPSYSTMDLLEAAGRGDAPTLVELAFTR